MNAQEIINRADSERPNMIAAELKLKYLNEIEGIIFNEIILTHAHEEGAECPVHILPAEDAGEEEEQQEAESEEESEEETEEETEETEEEEPAEDPPMLVPEAYEELYVYWLYTKIDIVNQEMDKYNNDRLMFDVSYRTFGDYWNRTHIPVPVVRQIWI